MPELTTLMGFPESEDGAEWEDLARRDPHATVFQTPRFLQVWHETLGGRVHPRIRLLHDEGRLVGALGEELERVGTSTGPSVVLRFLGGTEVTDYQGPVAEPAYREELVRAWLERLAEDREWDEVVATGLPEEAGWHELIARHAEKLGLTVAGVEPEDACPRIALPDSYDEYLSALPSKHRHEIRRKARKLARDAGPVRLVSVEPDMLPQALDAFFAMAGDGHADKARFFLDERMRGFFGALADEFAAEDVFRFHALEVDGKVAAATVSLVWNGEWGLYNSAFDQTLRSLAPGMVLIGELLRLACEEAQNGFDLLRGDEPYKYRFGATDRRLSRVTLTRSR